MNPVVDERTSFASDGLSLEGVLTYPQDESPARGVLLLSPHPNFAGNLDNNVIRELAAALAGSGLGVLRFNYRGVGQSTLGPANGDSAFEYWERVESEKLYEPIVADADAALESIGRTLAIDEARIAVVGYSFGAIIGGLLACRRSGIECLAAIAPPLRRYAFDFLRGNAVPKRFFFSTSDFLYDEGDIEELRRSLREEASTSMVPSDDHFFRGFENGLAARVLDYLQEPAG